MNNSLIALEGMIPSVPIMSADPDTQARIESLRLRPQVEMPLEHEFQPGVYLRTIYMPAGVWVIGHVHRGEHFNLVLRGKAAVGIGGKWGKLEAPAKFSSPAGAQKELYIVEEMVFTTIHANPTEERDIAKLEELLFAMPPEFVAEKGSRTLDDFRMSATRQLLQ